MQISKISTINFCSAKTLMEKTAKAAKTAKTAKTTIDFGKSSYSVPEHALPERFLPSRHPFNSNLQINVAEILEAQKKAASKKSEPVVNFISESSMN